jgi:hypothetical protein
MHPLLRQSCLQCCVSVLCCCSRMRAVPVVHVCDEPHGIYIVAAWLIQVLCAAQQCSCCALPAICGFRLHAMPCCCHWMLDVFHIPVRDVLDTVLFSQHAAWCVLGYMVAMGLPS